MTVRDGEKPFKNVSGVHWRLEEATANTSEGLTYHLVHGIANEVLSRTSRLSVNLSQSLSKSTFGSYLVQVWLRYLWRSQKKMAWGEGANHSWHWNFGQHGVLSQTCLPIHCTLPVTGQKGFLLFYPRPPSSSLWSVLLTFALSLVALRSLHQKTEVFINKMSASSSLSSSDKYATSKGWLEPTTSVFGKNLFPWVEDRSKHELLHGRRSSFPVSFFIPKFFWFFLAWNFLRSCQYVQQWEKRTPTKILTMSSVFNNYHKQSIWNVQRRLDPTTQRLTLHTTENTITDQFQTSAFSASL